MGVVGFEPTFSVPITVPCLEDRSDYTPKRTKQMKKHCTCCKTKKPLLEFGYRKTEKRYQSYCKKCLYKYQMNRWIERKKWAISYLGGKCSRCGIID